MKYSKLKNDLEDFANQINDYTVTDYKERRDEIHNAINQADTLKNQIEFQCNELENNNSVSSNDQDTATKTKNEIQSKERNIIRKFK